MLPLPIALLLAADPSSSSSSALDIVDDVKRGCEPKLLGDKRYPFFEAQAACDAYLTFALVDEVLDGADKPARVAAINDLIDDLTSERGRRAFKTAPNSVLYRGYLLLSLSGLAAIDALSPERAKQYDDVAAALVADLDKHTWLSSFQGPNAIWPCDHALAAAGLVLHGTFRHDDSSRAAGDAVIARLEALRASKDGFATRVDDKGRVVEKGPRGTVLAWTAGFLGIAGVDTAKQFATTLVDDLCGEPAPGMSACREWPKGSKRGEDSVSGPIVMGWGTGASALAIGAARINGRAALADQLASTSATTFALLHANVGPLERSILAWGATARPWIPTTTPATAR